VRRHFSGELGTNAADPAHHGNAHPPPSPPALTLERRRVRILSTRFDQEILLMCPDAAPRRKRPRWTWIRRLFTWSCTFVGGALIGTALFLWAQLSGIRLVREQYGDLNFIEESIGKLTFVWRSVDEKLVLALADVPEIYLAHGDLLVRTLAVAGLVVLVLPVVRRPGGSRAPRPPPVPLQRI
jgi:hypothetical protein